MWQPFDNGRMIGTSGSEKGIIPLDEEHVNGARITLERDGYPPFAITCGIYGWMLHTLFFAKEDHARRDYEDIKQALDRIVQSKPEGGGPFEVRWNPDREAKSKATIQMIHEFVESYP